MALFHDVEFWIAVAFVVFAIALYRMAFKRVADALDKRGETIKNEIEEATRLREEAQALLARHQGESRSAEERAKGILAQAEAEAIRLRADSARELENSLKRREQNAMDRIAQAEAAALAEVRGVAVMVAIAAARRLIGENLTDQQRSRLIDNAVGDLDKKPH